MEEVYKRPKLNGTIYKESEIIYHLPKIKGKKVRVLRKEDEDTFTVGFVGKVTDIKTEFMNKDYGGEPFYNLITISIDISDYREENQMLECKGEAGEPNEKFESYYDVTGNTIEVLIAVQTEKFQVILLDNVDDNILVVYDEEKI